MSNRSSMLREEYREVMRGLGECGAAKVIQQYVDSLENDTGKTTNDPPTFVVEEDNYIKERISESHFSHHPMSPGFSHEQMRAIADALNSLEKKEGGQ